MRKLLLLPLLSILFFGFCSADSKTVSWTFHFYWLTIESHWKGLYIPIPIDNYVNSTSVDYSCTFSNYDWSSNNLNMNWNSNVKFWFGSFESDWYYEYFTRTSDTIESVFTNWTIQGSQSFAQWFPLYFSVINDNSSDMSYWYVEVDYSCTFTYSWISASSSASDCSEQETTIETLSGSLSECEASNASCAWNYISCQSDLDSFENYNASLNRQLQACLLWESISETGSISLLTLYQLEWTEWNDVFHLPINSDLTLPAWIGAVSNNGVISIQKISNDYSMDSESAQRLNDLFIAWFIAVSGALCVVVLTHYIKKFLYSPFISK